MQTRILSSSDSGVSDYGNESTADQPTADTDLGAAEANNGQPKPSIKQALLAAAFAADIVTVILLAFSWPTVASDPKDLPLAAVGNQEQIDQVAANAPGGMLDLKQVDSRAEAQQLIREREVQGAFVLGDNPEILTSPLPLSRQLDPRPTQVHHRRSQVTGRRLQPPRRWKSLRSRSPTLCRSATTTPPVLAWRSPVCP